MVIYSYELKLHVAAAPYLEKNRSNSCPPVIKNCDWLCQGAPEVPARHVAHSVKKLEEQMTTRGHCLCKKTRWEFVGEVTWACFCHCDDCRRNCAAPVVAWLGVPIKNFEWSGDAPKTLESSKSVFRHFCNDCGSPMGFEADHYSGGMHLYAASLETPEDFEPKFHVNYQNKLPWLQMSDDLTKYEGTLLHAPEDLSDYNS